MRSTNELKRIDTIIEMNLSRTHAETMELITNEGLTISKHRLRSIRNYMLTGTAGQPKTIRPEPPARTIAPTWTDPAPDCLSDWEPFKRLKPKMDARTRPHVVGEFYNPFERFTPPAI